MIKVKTPYEVHHIPSGRTVSAPAYTARQALALGLRLLASELPSLSTVTPIPRARECVVRLHGWEVPVGRE